LSRLFDDLSRPETSGQATVRWQKLAESSLAAKRYLASHLGSLIDVPLPNDTISPTPWVNAVGLAVEFKLGDVAPALAKKILYNTNGGAISEPGISGYPAAEALAKIGDASIPALQNLLQDGTEFERTQAVYVLLTINSPRSKAVLHRIASQNRDPAITSQIQRNLQPE
jgi:hypothetical protein